MNKYLILLLVICIVSVNAYVKRDAPAPTQQNYIEDVKKQFEDISKSIGQQLQHAINPDEIKKHLNEFTENVNKAIDSFKTSKAQ